MHHYRLASFACPDGAYRWECTSCPRIVHQKAGKIEVQVAGLESAVHVGRENILSIVDEPERGAFEVDGPIGRFIRSL